jgi:c-di-GMP-binding flagellar brake protein YcgR
MMAQLQPVQKPFERRKHQRVKVIILGRYMLTDRREYPCQTIDMSPGGVAVHAPVKGKIGERVIIYFDQLGRVEGTIVRHLETGFAVALSVPVIKREKLADQLTWLANRQSLGMPEDRRHDRVVPHNPRSTLILNDGREFMAKIVDLSISGAALSTDANLPVGTPVMLGKTQAIVVRSFADGVAIEFSRLIQPEQFDETFVP